jgi:hypothetical protein
LDEFKMISGHFIPLLRQYRAPRSIGAIRDGIG